MNDYGVSPFTVLQMMGPMMIIGPMLLWLLVIGPLLIYPIARWKAQREQVLDTQLGIKVALHYFRMLGFQVLLVGAVILIWTIISKGSGDKGDFYRAAFGFLMPAGIVFALHSMFINKTNDLFYPTVRRLFLGYNLMTTGLVGFIALVLASQALFAKGSSGNEGRMFFAAVIVYCGAWVACGMQFGKLVLGDFGQSAGGPPANVIPPPSAMPPPPAAAGGNVAGLPPLSSGSFPPIEPK